jgi:adenine deaminase
MQTTIEGLIPDFEQRTFFPGAITIGEGKIASVERLHQPPESLPYILPGFIDSHVHIESSMLVPSEFARLAVVHGTVATVSDPHEIANVCGLDGVHFMLENGARVPFKFYFGAPSCVPATDYETAGAILDKAMISQLLENPAIKYLSEMMNFPGVLQGHPDVMEKIDLARQLGKPVDGHAPGLRGEEMKRYIDSGISTDHECSTREEALEKLEYGMKIIIREGSAAKNFDALIDLLHDYSDRMMFCSDDKHPDSLVNGHIDQLCARAVARGVDVFKVLQAACVNPVLHYNLDVGLLKEGDPADFIMVEDLHHFRVIWTYIRGTVVAGNGTSHIERVNIDPINQFNTRLKQVSDFTFPWLRQNADVEVIEAIDGQLITNKLVKSVSLLISPDGNLESNLHEDLLKIVVVNRYQDAPVSRAFIHNFGLKKGALASTVAHDSHNIIAVGVDDFSITEAVNLLIRHQGGISFYRPAEPGGKEEQSMIIPLPVAGLMSTGDGYRIASEYSSLDRAVKDAGCTHSSPFMTLSFMALLVIPSLKLSDLGLFDGERFCFIDQHENLL